MDNHWDLIVIGGGASGFFTAITCAEASGKRVLILEKTAHVLGKVKISGGGRCNVTHACFEPKPLTTHYPRGEKSLIGPFHRFGASDTVEWFEQRGLTLKTESDGRMFPVSNTSQSVVDTLTQAACNSGVEIRVSTGVESINAGEHFTLTTNKKENLTADKVMLATGGTRLSAGARLAQSLGHELIPNVPSLFAFNIDDSRITDLPGVSVAQTEVRVEGSKLTATGPLLITHHGFSGPGILKLSAWGARELHEKDYNFYIKINWLPDTAPDEIKTRLTEKRDGWGKRRVRGHRPFDSIPKRLWDKLCEAAGIAEETTWSQLNKEATQLLINELNNGQFHVTGKSINKDEFVTCGGVPLKSVTLKTMESKIQPGLHFAGEVLDIDGITGGFNFQNAWTTGYLAGTAIANS